ncbi:MAG TPA: hydroxymethylpyrimidine/phosphomethylpyrimidine kinase [Moraxellaceae bacterium]|nr:hydroxymethylpyrimidine/phosphomethylpyrimidine kinase [Moraxellaceae bacterium]
MRPVVLCFSGLDPSGGAGLHADIETIATLGGVAAVACTALTIQDSQRVYGFEAVSPDLVMRQAEAVLADLPVKAIKLGMLGSVAMIDIVARILAAHPDIPVVMDPVLSANSGGSLSDSDLTGALDRLLPMTTLLTPNTVEARRLGATDDLAVAIARLSAKGAQNILLKGGHEPGDLLQNRLFQGDTPVYESRVARLPGEYHGSGCTLAAAIAAGIASGADLVEAVRQAEAFVRAALSRADCPRQEGQRIPWRMAGARP